MPFITSMPVFTVLALGRRAVAVTAEADAGPLAPAAATVTVTGVLPLAGPAGPHVPGPFQVQRAVAAAAASTWHCIANTAFARSGGPSRGLARTAALATGLKWPIMAFARSTIP